MKQSKILGEHRPVLTKARGILHSQTSSNHMDVDGLESVCLSIEPCLCNSWAMGMCLCSWSYRTQQKPEHYQWLLRASQGHGSWYSVNSLQPQAPVPPV